MRWWSKFSIGIWKKKIKFVIGARKKCELGENSEKLEVNLVGTYLSLIENIPHTRAYLTYDAVSSLGFKQRALPV